MFPIKLILLNSNLQEKYHINFNPKKAGKESNIFDLDDDFIKSKSKEPLKESDRKKIDQNKEQNIEQIHIYPEDRISEFKEKIYLTTDIQVYRQYLFIKSDDKFIPMKYRILSDRIVDIDIRNIFKLNTKILDIPVDLNLFQNKEYLDIEASDYTTLIIDIYKNYGVNTFYLIDLNDFINQKYELLKELINKDTYQFQLIYYGFIYKYFPMMTIDVFKDYINNPDDLSDIYPDLDIKKSIIKSKYLHEKIILDEKYRILNSNELKKYNPNINLINLKSDIISIAIKSAVASNIDKIKNKINIRNLFDQIKTTNEIPLIRARLMINGQIINLTKIKTDDLDIQKIYESIKYRLTTNVYDLITLVLKIKDIENEYLILMITDKGKYKIKTSFNEDISMNFNGIHQIINQQINPIIELINNFGRSVFENSNKLPLTKISNMEFSDLHLSIFWKIPISRKIFEKFPELIKDDLKSEIIKANYESEYQFYFHKGIISPLIKNYEYLSIGKEKQKNMDTKNCLVMISHRTTDTKIEVQNLRENEFLMFYQYIILLLYRIEKFKLSSNDKTKPEIIGNLKMLKSRDPNLYNFKTFGSDIVYSRICQKDHQPVPYLPEEYELLDEKIRKKVIKYWNFSTDSEMYYYCPNKKYPHFSFLIGHHPNNYCIPCCKKTTVPNQENEINKKENVYNICINNHCYTEQDTQGEKSRYIYNYGKLIDVGRISKLPDIIDRYLLYNTGETYSEPEISFQDKTYSYGLILKNTANNTIYEEPVEKYRPDIVLEKNTELGDNNLAFPIIVYLNKKTKEVKIFSGLNKIQKALKQNVKKIKVCYITKSQLNKSEIKQESKQESKYGGAIKKPGYYLYGVPQNNENINNIGAVYSISSALDISFQEFITKIVSFLTKNKNIIKILLDGKLKLYFNSINDLINVITNLFIDKNNFIFNNKFYLWNELFIDLTKHCFNKYVIILDDITTDTTGTSIKNYNIQENINLILPIRISNVNEIIPKNSNLEYILLLRKKKKSKSLIGSDKLFYPIFIFVPQLFFKNFGIEKKIFAYSDEIIRLIRIILFDAILDTNKNNLKLEIDFNISLEFIEYLRKNQKIVKIKELLFNMKNNCYALVLDIDGNILYFPIKFTSQIASDNSENQIFNRNLDNLISYKKFKEIIEDYNNFVVEKSETVGMLRYSEDDKTLSKLE